MSFIRSRAVLSRIMRRNIVAFIILSAAVFLLSCSDANISAGLYSYLMALTDNQTSMLKEGIDKYEPGAAKLSEYQSEHERLTRFLYYDHARVIQDFIRDKETGELVGVTAGGVPIETWKSNGFDLESRVTDWPMRYYYRLHLKPDFREKYSNEAIRLSYLIMNAKCCNDRVIYFKEELRFINMTCGIWERVKDKWSVSKCQGGYLVSGEHLGIDENRFVKGAWYFNANTNDYSPADHLSNALYVRLTRSTD